MISHEEVSDLLGAYALDAVDGEERAQVEQHLDECPRCRAELDSMREVAGALGTTVEPLPEGLWSNIASRLPERLEANDPPPMPRLGRDRPASVSGHASRRRRRRGRVAVASLGAVAVAAAAAAVVLGIGLVHANNRADNLAMQPSTAAAALATPGHKVVNLRDGKHMLVARFVVVPDGRGYLLSSYLPPATSGATYQLWGIVAKKPISLGLLGPDPKKATFTMAGTSRPATLAISEEPSGGSVAPTATAILATGAV
jgi:anti-sigma factor RsiW